MREAQIQLILYPLIERLLAHFGDKSQLEHYLCNILAELPGITLAQTGYAGGNLLNLFYYLKTELKELDFCHLDLRQAYLLNTVLHD